MNVSGVSHGENVGDVRHGGNVGYVRHGENVGDVKHANLDVRNVRKVCQECWKEEGGRGKACSTLEIINCLEIQLWS